MSKALRVLLPFFVLLLGAGVFWLLLSSKPEAQKKALEELGALVEATPVSRTSHTVVVRAQGSVTPAEQVMVQPEVGGRVTWRNDNLVPGGLIGAGELLVRLDAKNYQLALQQQEAQVNRAELELSLEESRKSVAEREWQLLNQQGTSQANPLALREPHLKTARVGVDAAKSALDSARLTVSKTTLIAPFNAFVQRARADKGQLLSPGSEVATLIGVDRFWVQISVPLENLSWIQVPGLNGKTGSSARVYQQIGQLRIERTGRVVRLLGDLDPVGRMARVLVEIEDPFNLRARGERGLPMLVGAFVNVEIDGGKLENVIEVPRVAVRDGDSVHVFSDRRLDIRAIGVVWRTPDSVLVRDGLSPGDLLITSRIGGAIDGMLLRLAPNVVDGSGAPTVERR